MTMTGKKIWIRADTQDTDDLRKEIVRTSLENNLMDIIILDQDRKRFEKLGKFNPIVFDGGEIKTGEGSGALVTIQTKEDEISASDLAGSRDLVVVSAMNWKVIPLENLIAGFQGSDTALLAEVGNSEEARLLLETLEIGVDGVVLNTDDFGEILKLRRILDDLESDHIELVQARITRMKPLGTGDRVCIDTCSMLNVGEGMLVGSQASGLFFIHSESINSEYVDTRPFRVNAGPVHSYVQAPGDRTRYLSDLHVGEEVVAIDIKGNTRPVIIGRTKIERRPLILIEAEHGGDSFNIILQNAETIRLISDNEPVSIVDLKAGDDVLMCISEGGRHFGMRVDETVVEK